MAKELLNGINKMVEESKAEPTQPKRYNYDVNQVGEYMYEITDKNSGKKLTRKDPLSNKETTFFTKEGADEHIKNLTKSKSGSNVVNPSGLTDNQIEAKLESRKLDELSKSGKENTLEYKQHEDNLENLSLEKPQPNPLAKGPEWANERKHRLDMINPNEYRVSEDKQGTGSKWETLKSFNNEKEARDYFNTLKKPQQTAGYKSVVWTDDSGKIHAVEPLVSGYSYMDHPNTKKGLHFGISAADPQDYDENFNLREKPNMQGNWVFDPAMNDWYDGDKSMYYNEIVRNSGGEQGFNQPQNNNSNDENMSKLVEMARNGATAEQLRDYVLKTEPNIDPFDDLNNIVESAMETAKERDFNEPVGDSRKEEEFVRPKEESSYPYQQRYSAEDVDFSIQNYGYPLGTSEEYTKKINDDYAKALPILEKAGVDHTKFATVEDAYKEMKNRVFGEFQKKYPNGNNDAWVKDGWQQLYNAFDSLIDKIYNDWYIVIAPHGFRKFQ